MTSRVQVSFWGSSWKDSGVFSWYVFLRPCKYKWKVPIVANWFDLMNLKYHTNSWHVILHKQSTLKEWQCYFCCLQANNVTGVSLELSDREKFCNIFRISGRSFGPNLGLPYMCYTYKLLPQLKIGRVSQLRETFSPKSPPRLSPGLQWLFNEYK